ncbi:Prophage minor tail protein Z (GPZ) [Serratia rubidaea]|uniref:Prophage minor tail protein Z (GPZ) n=1 Tax=Serratia rubidaea TaxID=61652 RepID=A0A447QES6_SERRU|nr:Prophage minor tail protein Z (GPZ) [Serratia rubidaea]
MILAVVTSILAPAPHRQVLVADKEMQMAVMKGLEQAISNLNSISKNAVPKASAQAINRVASRAISRSTKRVSAETRIQQKLIRQRARLKRASPEQNPPRAVLSINRGNMPAIKLGAARLQLSRRSGGIRKGSVLKIGRFTFRNAFIQQLSNGRWHVLRRVGHARYPIEVVKIPLAQPLTEAYREESASLLQSDMGKEMGYALKNQLRLHLLRRVR